MKNIKSDIDSFDDISEWFANRLEQGDPFAAAFAATRMPMVISNPRLEGHPIIFANDAFKQLTGYASEEVVGRNCRFLQGPNTDQNTIKKISRAIANEEPVQVEILNYRKDGTQFWNSLSIHPVHNEDHSLQYYFAGQMDVTDRVEADRLMDNNRAVLENEVSKRTEELRIALERQEMLVHEVDHRVKNNLAMIGALIRMHGRKLDDPTMKHLLESLQGRIHSMAMVHQELQNPVSGDYFDLARFSEHLTTQILDNAGRNDIKVEAQLNYAELPHKFAAPLGLIINELVTNAIQHAFDERSGILTVATFRDEDTAYLQLTDDGSGKDIHSPRGDSLGSELVERLTAQMRSTVIWDSSSQGTSVKIGIPVESEA